MIWIGLRRSERAGCGRCRCSCPVSWLSIAVIFLIGFRVGLNVTELQRDRRRLRGRRSAPTSSRTATPLYGTFPKDNPHGDTYGPGRPTRSYVPFEAALPWKGKWDDLPAAHARGDRVRPAVHALLFLIGRRVRGPGLGTVLAYAWATFPLTLYVANTNSNDALVAVFALAAILFATSAPARGAMAALGGLTKFGSLGLAPLLATHGPAGQPLVRRADAVRRRVRARRAPSRWRRWCWEASRWRRCTTARWASRSSAARRSRSGASTSSTSSRRSGRSRRSASRSAVALVLPPAPDVIGLGALAAAVLIALQLGVTHWFYLYVAWFFGLALIALLGRYAEPPAR